MNEAVEHVEKIVKKKASSLSADERRELQEFSQTYNPLLEQMEKNVNTAKDIVGETKDTTFNDFAKAIAGLKRLIRVSRERLETV